jgi:valyl-tRNA synthetase
MSVDRAEQAAVWSLAEFHADHSGPGVGAFQARTLEDGWILSRFNRVTDEVNRALETYRFHEAANRVYDFFWTEFCDWYIELMKPRLAIEDSASRDATRTAFTNVVSLFEAALRLLHPFMPFITEEIWHAIYDGKPPLKSIALAPFPQLREQQVDLVVEMGMAVLQDLIVGVRNLRADLRVEPPRQPVPIEIHAADEVRTLVEQNRGAVERLAAVSDIRFVESSLAKLPGARTTARFEVRVVYERKVDAVAERERLRKELDRLEREIGNTQRQLGNQGFLDKAPAHVVEGLRKKAVELELLLDKTRGALGELGQ